MLSRSIFAYYGPIREGPQCVFREGRRTWLGTGETDQKCLQVVLHDPVQTACAIVPGLVCADGGRLGDSGWRGRAWALLDAGLKDEARAMISAGLERFHGDEDLESLSLRL